MMLQELRTRLIFDDSLKTRNRVLFSTVDSTNRVGKRIASFYQRNGDELPVVLLAALQQTAGRGRLGNSWLSPPGGVYVSFVLPGCDRQDLLVLPMKVATALCRHLDALLVPPCRLRWPNDLMVDGQKIGGILIEVVGTPGNFAAIVGFGINYSADLSELDVPVTHIVREAADPPTLPVVAMDTMRVVENQLSTTTAASEVVRSYGDWSLMEVGQETRCRTASGVEIGEFLGFDDRGFLRLATAGGEKRISSGQVLEDGHWHEQR